MGFEVTFAKFIVRLEGIGNYALILILQMQFHFFREVCNVVTAAANRSSSRSSRSSSSSRDNFCGPIKELLNNRDS
jgi:hypothetical protein